ncbi:MAG TPA: protein kinase [Kofleriaceae bacterium]|nr:protein kinase [Kofleriaceae bacterium]
MITAGQTIGNYRILNKIGTGGMGAVYLAEHPLIGKRVALKVIHHELAGNRDVVSRFFQEARAVNKIGNEHIVEIHDFGVTPEGDHFFIMEYLDGRTLASILSREKAIDVMRSLHIGAQIANALAAAHAAGIIHRDLKPDNIMLMQRLGDQDFVKVLDFGLAKVFSAATAVKTAAGVLLGTPQYMSPEACESKRDLDHRTDIYALGVLLFQMMTGVLPFDGESMGEVLVKQVTALPPAPRGLNPAIPPSVEQILLRCLAKPVDARFATMQALREALLDPEAYLRGSPPIAPARSVAPGEALGEANPGLGHAAAQKTRPATNPHPLPLPASAMSTAGQGTAPTMIADHGAYAPVKRATTGMPALAPPQEFKMDTMRIATPLGYSSRPPRKVWPVVLAIALLLGFGGGGFAVWCSRGGDRAKSGGDVQAITDGGDTSSTADPAGRSGNTGSNSEAADAGSKALSSVPGNATGSPKGANAGSGSAGATAGLGVTGTNGGSSVIGSHAGGSTAGATSGSGSASRAPPLQPATAHLSIDSIPEGATVTSSDGELLGKTPLKIEWPKTDLPVTFELKLAGYKKKQKQTVVNGNTALHIELERASVIRHPPAGAGSGSTRTNGGDNGLMRPDG